MFCTSNSDPAITNTVFEDNTAHAIYEASTDSDPTVTYCLFHSNPDGDYWDENRATFTGANDINMNIAEASNNVEGDPLFVVGVSGTRTTAPVYNASTNRTTLLDSAASFAPGALAGRLINADTSQRRQALITSNTATTIEVVGNVTGYAGLGRHHGEHRRHHGCKGLAPLLSTKKKAGARSSVTSTNDSGGRCYGPS